MTTQLATKQDLQVLVTKLDELETRSDLRLQHLESRLLIRLGILMTVLFSAAAGLATLLR